VGGEEEEVNPYISIQSKVLASYLKWRNNLRKWGWRGRGTRARSMGVRVWSGR
jgi:hypothetical protein